MTSKSFSTLRRLRRISGYSLVELLASLVLIGMIAVLALPTYQDFEPHTDTLEPSVQSLEPDAAAGDALGIDGANADSAGQAGADDSAIDPEFDSADALADS